MLLLSLGMVGLPASAQPAPPTIFVSSSGSDTTGTGSVTAPYATISHAVAVAPNGAIINIEPGTYNDFVNVTESLTLESTSSQASNTIINAAGKSFGIWIRGSGASGTVIDGLTVENANSHGIYVQDTSNVLLENNQVVQNGLNPFTACPEGKRPSGPCVESQKAIELDGVSYSTVASNTVSGNVADGGIAVRSDGTALNPGALTKGENSSAIGNVIIANTITGNKGGCGIVVGNFDPGFPITGTTVSDNVVVGNPAGVIVATNGPFETVTNTTVSNNQILNNNGPGVDIVNVAGTISGTTLSSNLLASNAAPTLPPNGQPTGIAMASIAIPNLPPPVTTGTMIAENTIRDEYFGIYFQNTTVGTTVLQNSIDSSIKVPLTGVSLASQSVTTINSATTVQQAGTTVIQTADTTTPTILGILGIVIACIGVGIAVGAIRRKKS